MRLGETPTGAIVNGVRLVVAATGVGAALVAVTVAAITLLSEGPNESAKWRLYGAGALFVAGLALLAVAATFKIASHPFLIPDVVYKTLDSNKSVTDIETLVRALEAHAGPAGLFNRLGFSGLSLGTIASAFGVIVLGLLAMSLELIDRPQFEAFLDLAKLLIGAFVGSFAQHAGSRRAETRPTSG